MKPFASLRFPEVVQISFEKDLERTKLRLSLRSAFEKNAVVLKGTATKKLVKESEFLKEKFGG